MMDAKARQDCIKEIGLLQVCFHDNEKLFVPEFLTVKHAFECTDTG